MVLSKRKIKIYFSLIIMDKPYVLTKICDIKVTIAYHFILPKNIAPVQPKNPLQNK